MGARGIQQGVIEAREQSEAELLLEMDDDLPLVTHEYPNGFSAAELSEYYGTSRKEASKAIGALILRGAVTVLDASAPDRYVAAERHPKALGIPAGHIASLTGRPLDTILGEIKDACEVERIEHVKEGMTWYVRSKRDGTYRKPSDWLTASEKKEASVSTVSDIRQKALTASSLPPASSPSTTPPKSDGKVTRTTAGLRDALFDALDDLRGPKPDVARALATAKLAQAIITSAKAEMDFHDRLNRDKQLETDFTTDPLKLGSDAA